MMWQGYAALPHTPMLRRYCNAIRGAFFGGYRETIQLSIDFPITTSIACRFLAKWGPEMSTVR